MKTALFSERESTTYVLWYLLITHTIAFCCPLATWSRAVSDDTVLDLVVMMKIARVMYILQPIVHDGQIVGIELGLLDIEKKIHLVVAASWR